MTESAPDRATPASARPAPALAALVTDYRVDRYPSYDARWSDHAPVIVELAG